MYQISKDDLEILLTKKYRCLFFFCCWIWATSSEVVYLPQQRRRETSIADEFRTALDALAAPFEALGDGISDVAKDVAKTEVWKTVETKCLPLQKRRPGRKALK